MLALRPTDPSRSAAVLSRSKGRTLVRGSAVIETGTPSSSEAFYVLLMLGVGLVLASSLA